MSRQASIAQLSEDDSASGSMRFHRRRGGCHMESQDSTASRDSISRYTALFSCRACNASWELRQQGDICLLVLNKGLKSASVNMF